MNKILKSTISWVFYVAFLLGLAYGAPKAMAYILKTNYPMAAITSGSMWPALKKGDLVLIKGVQVQEEVEVGDIIVYRNPLGFTIHRIIKINNGSVITQGDANNTADQPVKFEDIIGKTLTLNQKPIRIPFLGNISILLNKNKANAY